MSYQGGQDGVALPRGGGTGERLFRAHVPTGEPGREVLSPGESPLPNPGVPWLGRRQDSLARRLSVHRGETPALVTAEGVWTHAEFQAATDRLAAHLTTLTGTRTGYVAIVGARTAGFVVAWAAVIKAGLGFVILDPAFPEERIRRCLALARPQGLIDCAGNGAVSPAVAEAMRTHAGGGFGLTIPGGRQALAASLDRLTATPRPTGERPAINAGTEGRPLYVAFTSGSTGTPKAVFGDHDPVVHFIDWQQRQFGLQAGDRVSMLSGLGHDPLLRDVLMPLCVGAAVCLPPPEVFTVPRRLHAWLAETGVTVCHLTPSLAALILAGSTRGRDTTLDALRWAFFGGEPLKYQLVRRFAEAAPRATCINCYGATETPQIAAFHVITREEVERAGAGANLHALVPIGRGIDGFQLLVRNAAGRLCGVGEEGEICVRSPYLAREVQDESGRARDVFAVNPMTGDPTDRIYCTGDFGAYREDGSVVYAGRRDRQVKIRGHRVELEEVDRLLADEPGVLAYFCDVVTQGDAGNSLVLYVVPEPGMTADAAGLRGQLAARLPSYVLPDRVVIVSEIPLTPNGKLDRDRLRLHEMPAPVASVDRSAADLEAKVGALCAAQLGLPTLGRNDRLVDAGLNSLQSVLLCCALAEQLGANLTVADLVDCPTVADLAKRIGEVKDTKAGFESGLLPALEARAAVTGASPPAGEAGAASDGGLFSILPRNESFFAAVKNRVLQLIARVAPDALRVKCHRWRGVALGRNVSVGYDSVIETAYPWLVRVGDDVNIGMRVTIIAHFRGMGTREKGAHTVEIDDLAFIGPGVIILPNVRIGRGAVISAGSVVNASIPPMVMAHGNPAVPVARCGIPLSGDASYGDFVRQLRPL